MADLLPDIDTTNVGFIAWWNALDHDASFLDPVDLLGYGGVADYTAYDNGITGDLERDSRLRWRAKTDGWIVTYYDTTRGSVDDIDFVNEYEDGGVDIIQNVLSEELNNLRLEAENAAEMNFAHEDVGLGDYRDRTPGIDRFESYKYKPPGPARWAHRDGQYPEKLYLTGRSRMNVNGESITPIEWNTRTLVPEQSGEGESVGQVEATSEGWTLGEGRVHRMTGGVPTYEDSDVRAGIISVHS